MCVCVCVCVCVFDKRLSNIPKQIDIPFWSWYGLVSLFNGISTFVGDSMSKLPL